MLLTKLYEKNIIQKGTFTLKSGEISNIYIEISNSRGIARLNPYFLLL